MDGRTAYGLEYDDACQSCGAELEWIDDHRCRGCGLFVCGECTLVFEHVGESDGGKTRHRTGDPAAEIARLRAELEEAREFEASIRVLARYYSGNMKLSKAIERVDAARAEGRGGWVSA